MLNRSKDYINVKTNEVMSYLDWQFYFQDKYDTDFIEAENILIEAYQRGILKEAA